MPDTWEWCRFGSYTLNRDNERKPVSSVQRKKVKKIYDYYGASGVIDQTDSFLFDEKLLLIGEDGANLLARTKPIAFLADGKYWVNNHAHCIDSIDKRLLDFICVYINAINLFQYITGSAQPKLNQDNMNRILMPIPPKAEQERILERIKIILSNINDIDSLKGKLQSDIVNAKSRILDLAIRGKLVPQDPNDEPAAVLLERIRTEKEELIKQGKIKRDKKESVIFKGDDNSYYYHIENGSSVYDEKLELPSNWIPCTISDISYILGNKENQIQTNEILNYGKYPVVSQSQEYIDGYCDFEEKAINNVPVILFGDHTRIVKFIDFPFVIGADGTKIFKIIAANEKYIYYWMQFASNKIVSKGYARHYGLLKKSCLCLPPLAEQKRIVDEIEKIFATLDDIANKVV